MIGPVSGTGRAMMASLQQAIQKGMPPDQAIQYVKSMATQGVAPLTDLYSMMNQFQRLKQQQVQPPQTPPTIRDQLNMMDQQQQMQQGNIQQMQAPPPPGQPMDRGLGGIDAGLMQYPQFAGGGIVAFQEGGGPASSGANPLDVAREQIMAMIDEAEQKGDFTTATVLRGQLRRAMTGKTEGEFSGEAFGGLKSIGEFLRRDVEKGRPWTGTPKPVRFFGESANQAAAAPAAPQSAVPTAASPFATFDQAADFARRGVRQDIAPPAPQASPARGATAGAGSRSVAAKDPFADLITAERARKFEEVPDTFTGEEKARIEKQIAGLSAEKKDAARMALAQAGFAMAAAAARGGRQRTSTLGALAEGAIGGLQQYSAAQKELRQTERELNKEVGMLRRYQDEVARGERTAKRAFEEARADNIANLTAKSEQLKLSQAELAQQLKIANIRATGNERLADQLMGMYDAYDRETDPAKREQLKQAFESRLAASERIIRSTTAGGVGTGAREAIAIQNAVEDAKNSNAYKVADRAYNTATRAGDTAAAQRANAARQQVLMDARRQAESILGVSGVGNVPTIGGGTYQGPYAGFSAEPIG